jgi:hypothetical protein
MDKLVKSWIALVVIGAASQTCFGQSTINYTAGIAQRDVLFGTLASSAIVPNGNEVQIGYFNSGFDLSGNAGNIFALMSAWHELAFTNIATLVGEPGRFGSTAVTSDPNFDGKKISLFLFKTANNGTPLPDFSNVDAYGIFSSTATEWKFPDHTLIFPGNTTDINSSQVNEVFHGDYDPNHLYLSPVPEPGTCVLLGMAGAGLVIAGLRRRSK